MPEQVFLMLKPDAFKRKLVGEIISKIEKEGGLVLKKCLFVEPEKEKIEEWFDQKDKFGKKNYPPKERIVKYLLSGPIMPMIWEGENALESARKIVGSSTNPPDAKIGTIRRESGIDTIEKATKEERAVENLIHASRTRESAKREIAFWFGETKK